MVWILLFLNFQGWGCCHSLPDQEKCSKWCSWKHLRNCEIAYFFGGVEVFSFLTPPRGLDPTLLNFLFHASFMFWSRVLAEYIDSRIVIPSSFWESQSSFCIYWFSYAPLAHSSLVNWAKINELTTNVCSSNIFTMVYIFKCYVLDIYLVPFFPGMQFGMQGYILLYLPKYRFINLLFEDLSSWLYLIVWSNSLLGDGRVNNYLNISYCHDCWDVCWEKFFCRIINFVLSVHSQ